MDGLVWIHRFGSAGFYNDFAAFDGVGSDLLPNCILFALSRIDGLAVIQKLVVCDTCKGSR